MDREALQTEWNRLQEAQAALENEQGAAASDRADPANRTASSGGGRGGLSRTNMGPSSPTSEAPETERDRLNETQAALENEQGAIACDRVALQTGGII